ncbi:MAG: hypothetical protein A2622_04420 [Bdellovibrionales bacterium RIFCSPHIGHO2_01_FULL_40_29]|nr:MAG: hypothetical protein A2622_04420 [Bdellovibrionales bacterium RIFCSPHIGHO2_01_FULL_40_29]OFZ34818.1 MAG: hypothetical protein A3D17_10955 [Bdellovibrionales bacterium RIFCSPHIGHO2_02_FULL_40_15]
MKKTLSKTLICGVIASSFILVNCQKAPSSRGVKGTKGSPANTAGKQTAEVQNLVKCTDEFNKVYEIFAKLYEDEDVKKIPSMKKGDTVTAEEKERYLALDTKLVEESERVEKEFVHMEAIENKKAEAAKTATKTVDGCYFDERKKSKPILRKEVVGFVNATSKKIEELTGEKTLRADAGREDAKKRQEAKIELETNITNMNAKFFVTKEFNEALDDAKIDESFFVNGQVQIGIDKLKEATADESLSVCWVSKTSGKLEDDTKPLQMRHTEIKESLNGKTEHEIIMLSGSYNYTINCLVPAKVTLDKAFRTAMGDLLKTKATSDEDKATEEVKSEEKKPAETKTEKVEPSTQVEEKITADVNKENLDAAKKIVMDHAARQAAAAAAAAENTKKAAADKAAADKAAELKALADKTAAEKAARDAETDDERITREAIEAGA